MASWRSLAIQSLLRPEENDKQWWLQEQLEIAIMPFENYLKKKI